MPTQVRAAVLAALLLSPAAAASPATELFQTVSTQLVQNYYGWSDLDRPALVERYRHTLDDACAAAGDTCSYDQGRAVLKTMLAELHDAHTSVKDAEAAERLREVQEDLTVPRSGARVVSLPQGLLVVSVMPGSPADQAGLRSFDLLTTVQGQPAGLNRAQDASAFVRLERAAQPFTVERRRAGAPDQTLSVGTAPLKARDEPVLSWLDRPEGRVALIQYPTFLSGDSAALFLKRLTEAQQGGAKGLVIDLRYNGGGRLDQCVSAVSAFGPTMYQARWTQGSMIYAALDGHPGSPPMVRGAAPEHALWNVHQNGPVTLLVGGNTASCAEVFGYFARKDGATLVGEATKGVMNSGVNFVPLPDRGVLSLTTLRAFDSAGQPLPDHLEPDVLAPTDISQLTTQGQDTTLQAALAQMEQPRAAAR
ncbi:S41 family peptidase [Deinococcus sonorensis]|uniref:S41 family peptidase n=2 Tax=Deinococcus sonorensis TaxID=309891 RepID=A0AAU7U7Z8_9DEIO